MEHNIKETESLDMHINKIKQQLLEGAYIYVALILSLIYIFYGIVKMEETGKSILQILADGMMSMIAGYSIGRLLSLQGYKSGGKDESLIAVRKQHRDKVESINKHLDKLEEYVKMVNEKRTKEARIVILSEEALCYEDFEKGLYKDYMLKSSKDKYSASQKKALKKAYHYRSQYLSSKILIRSGESNNLDSKKAIGETLEEHQKRENTKQFMSKILFAIVFGYFTIKMVEDLNWFNLIWTALQVVSFLAFGLMKFYSSKIYMQTTLVDRYQAQIDELVSFESWLEKQPKEEKKEKVEVENVD